MENENKGVTCTLCGKLPGFVSESLEADQVYFALECDCPKRTSFMRSKTFVQAEWESSTHKLSKEAAKKVEGPCPSDKDFKT